MDTETKVICRKYNTNYNVFEQESCAQVFIKKKSKKTLRKEKKKSKTRRKKMKRIPIFEKKKMLKDAKIFTDVSTIPDDIVDVVFESVV